MTRHEFFESRLKEMGLFEFESDYEGLIGVAVLELSETFAEQRHSGMSAEITLELFNSLMQEYNDGGAHD